ncbi:hypothetical protein HPB47_015238 [Ixodes persulcatus]|uniref:Uncharacterized protein n=1 Tax=Ixodes persulcatus TaxID=34615 RepID=A0AC60QUX5_IXOPE|nr:hypothetical protein HPB47_015238 [Ixodes persulcatus]
MCEGPQCPYPPPGPGGYAGPRPEPIADGPPVDPRLKPNSESPLPPPDHNIINQQHFHPRGAARVWQWNCRGYRRKRGALTQFLATQEQQPDAIALQEAGCKRGHCSLFLLNVYSSPSKSKDTFNHLFRDALRIACPKDNNLLIVGDFNATHTTLGNARASAKGRKLMDAIDVYRLTLLNEPDQPTRIGNSTSRDTCPDLTLARTRDSCIWTNLGESLGSDHLILETEQWVQQIQEDVERATKTIRTTDKAPVVDPHLLHIWEARRSLTKRWRRQKYNRKLRTRIAKLTQEAEQYAEELTQTIWHKLCDQLQGILGTKQTWSLLRTLLDSTKTKVESNKALTKRPRPEYPSYPHNEGDSPHPLDADITEQEDVLLQLKKDILDYPGTAQTRAVLALDLKGAFDNVLHDTILEGLARIGHQRSGLILLTGRGTPQGSSGSDGEIQDALQTAADATQEYARAAGLSCAADKSELLLIRGMAKISINEEITVSIDGKPIPSAKRLRILGLQLQTDAKASFTVQVLPKQCQQIAPLIRRVTSKRRGLKEGDTIRIVQALLVSRMVYHAPFQNFRRKEIGALNA